MTVSTTQDILTGGNQNPLLRQIAAAAAAKKKADAKTKATLGHQNTAPGQGFLSNPAFDVRIRNIRSFDGTPMSSFVRGQIYTDKPIGKYYYGLNFLYNPTTVSVNHALDQNAITDPNAKNTNDPTTGLIGLQQSVSFSLLFDRTFEVWDKAKYGQSEVGQRGVQMDVLAAYRMLGITNKPTTAADGSITSDINGTQFFRPVGPMIQTAVRATFGSSMTYFGFIDSLNLSYVHWASNMVPTRCQMDINLTLLPDTEAGPVYGRVAADFKNSAFGNFTRTALYNDDKPSGKAGR